MTNQIQDASEERLEKKILLLSFLSGVGFVIIELIYSIYSGSQSTLMDALYDASELVFIILLLFLTPLFHQPISEKHPYGFFQLESFFILIKSIIMVSVTASVLTSVIERLVSGGSQINKGQVSFFQLLLGLVSLFILFIMKFMSRKVSSPTVKAEILGWKLDVTYSLGMSFAFFIAMKLQHTPFAFLSPYFDQIVAILIMLFMIPETIKLLIETFRELFLFSPEQQTVQKIKEISNEIFESCSFTPVFYDISKTGRKIWVSIYFRPNEDSISMKRIHKISLHLNEQLNKEFSNVSCEIIPDNYT